MVLTHWNHTATQIQEHALFICMRENKFCMANQNEQAGPVGEAIRMEINFRLKVC